MRSKILSLVLCLCSPFLTACPSVSKGGSDVDQYLAATLFTVSNTRRYLELVEQLYAPQSTVHLIDQNTALQLNAAGSNVIDYAGKLYSVFKQAGAATGKISITPQGLADALSYANAIKANFATVGGPGITSAAIGPLNTFLIPLNKTVDDLALRLQTLKATAKDSTFQVTLTPAQRKTYAELEVAVR